ncbi:TPA: hypothetical protein JD257_17415, partial [Proteus mirabilis]|nr:hypothetical protein [Proteus mirabilis]
MTSLRTVSKHPEQLETTPLIAESHHYDDPLAPQKLVFLEAVNQQRCVINSPQRNSQLTNTIPFFIILLVMAVYTLFGFIENHKSNYFTLQDNSNYFNEKYGVDNLPIGLSNYLPYMKVKEISIGTYLIDYYTDKIYRNDKFKILMIIGWLIFFPGFLWLFGYLSFFTPPVYLIADRQRGILYSYGMGK